MNKYIIAFIIGFSLEWKLSHFWDYNIPMVKLFNVPIFIVLAWTVLLPLSHYIRDQIFKKKTLLTDFTFILVGLYIVEFIGGNIIGLKLSVASQFPALMPYGVFNAPFILLVLYFIIINEYWRFLDNKPSLLLLR